MKPFHKYSTLFSLYIAQSVPMSFFSTVLPVILRMEKFSLTSIALLQFIKIPWVLKFLWAPAVDKNARSDMHYKRWIIVSELFYAACILTIAFFHVKTNFILIIVFMVLAIAFSATQDIASDALAIRILKKEERPFGNSIQSMGSFGGTLLGSGCLLLLFAVTGWTWLMVVLAAFVLIALVPLAIVVRPKNMKTSFREPVKVSMKDIGSFFCIPGMAKWVVVLVIYYAGILGILSILKPWMVDLGYSLKQIAFIVGIYGTGCGALGAFAAGFVVRKLGSRKSLLLFALINCIGAVFFLYLAVAGASTPLLYAAVTLLWVAYAMSTVIIYTIAMNKVRPGREGTDYTIQIVITHLMGMIVAAAAGRTADVFGMKGLFLAETIVALCVFGFIFYIPAAFYEKEKSLKILENAE